jgi:hypothetical protein
MLRRQDCLGGNHSSGGRDSEGDSRCLDSLEHPKARGAFGRFPYSSRWSLGSVRNPTRPDTPHMASTDPEFEGRRPMSSDGTSSRRSTSQFLRRRKERHSSAGSFRPSAAVIARGIFTSVRDLDRKIRRYIRLRQSQSPSH